MHRKSTVSTRKRKLSSTNDEIQKEIQPEIQPEKRQRKTSQGEEFLPLPQNEGLYIGLPFNYFNFVIAREKKVSMFTQNMFTITIIYCKWFEPRGNGRSWHVIFWVSVVKRTVVGSSD